MDICLAVLTDENLEYLVKSDLKFFLEPIKQNQKQYMKYHRLLGKMDKKSILVKKNLPNIVVKLYKQQDMNYVKAMEIIAKRYCDLLFRLVSDTLDRQITIEDFCDFSNEQVADMLMKFQESTDNVFEIELLKIQMKLIGFPNVDDRIVEILSLCGIEEEICKEEDLTEETMPIKTILKEKNVLNKSKVRVKKLTPEEKRAKTKAALEEKEKARIFQMQIQEETNNKEKKNIEEKYDEELETLIQSKNGKIKTNDMEDEKMSRYIGVVNIKSNFYNFTPIGIYENNIYTPYSENDLDKLLPKSTMHNINFWYSYYDNEQINFMKEKFSEGYPVLLNCEIEELKENRTPDGVLYQTGYKILAMEAWNQKKISPLSDMGLYVVLNKEELLDDIESKRAIRVEKEGLVEGEQVLVNLGDGFYAGPFTIKSSPTNYTLLQVVDGKQFVYGYNSSDCVRVIVEPSTDVESWIGYNSWCYYTIKNNAKRVVKDLISDRDLLDSFKLTLEKTKELDYSNLDIDGIIEKIGESQFVGGSSIPEEIREQRISRVRSIMSSEENLLKVSAEILDLTCELLLKNKDNIQIEKLLLEIMTKKPELLDKIPRVRAIQDERDSAKAELEQLEIYRTEIEAKIKNIQESDVESEIQKNNLNETLSEELIAKKAELNEIKEHIGVAKTVVNLQGEVEKLKDDIAYYERNKKEIENGKTALEENFNKLIKDYSNKMYDLTFDGFMSSKMLQAAANWETKVQSEERSSRVLAINEISTQEMSREELIDYLVRMVQFTRPGYTRNTIINIFTCIAQGFLTVFSGMPGCGKTSICNIISEVLGLNSYAGLSMNLKDEKRFISVSVERGWTSKRDFIGYFNPLTKTIEENNRQVFNGLRLLDIEKKKGYSKWPFIILLDEANLSPMEYYWADFMNVCDELNDNSSINLGNDNVFQIPETLHFLATINNDHTTETLSPRLIDRAWIITLPKYSSMQFESENINEQIKNVTWDEIKKVFTIAGYEKKIFDRETKIIYEGLKDKLSKQGLYVSPRVDIAIQNYWIVASKLMDEDEYGNSANLVALDYAVAQKILPKIIGSGEEYESWLAEVQSYCDKKGLLYSAELLNTIITRGNQHMQMKYYRFFN